MSKRRYYKKRPIIGPVEEVVISKGGHKKHRVLARIDTGADFSTICEKLAKKIGFEHIVSELRKVERIIKRPVKYVKQEVDILKNIKGVTGVVLVRQASGLTRRVFVPLSIKLAKKTIKTQVTIIKRTHMKYPMIIGRKDLQHEGFMIDPKRRR